ncbi:MAG: zinc ribbon domain-containing protein [Slackia sp.]
MSEILSQLWTPELQMAMMVFVVMLVILYVLSVVWVVRDAYLRGTMWYVWAIVALVPVVGIIAYCLLRPPLLQIDRDEQEPEVALAVSACSMANVATAGIPSKRYILCPLPSAPEEPCVKCGHAWILLGRSARIAQPPACGAGSSRRSNYQPPASAGGTSGKSGRQSPSARRHASAGAITVLGCKSRLDGRLFL